MKKNIIIILCIAAGLIGIGAMIPSQFDRLKINKRITVPTIGADTLSSMADQPLGSLFYDLSKRRLYYTDGTYKMPIVVDDPNQTAGNYVAQKIHAFDPSTVGDWSHILVGTFESNSAWGAGIDFKSVVSGTTYDWRQIVSPTQAGGIAFYCNTTGLLGYKYRIETDGSFQNGNAAGSNLSGAKMKFLAIETGSDSKKYLHYSVNGTDYWSLGLTALP